MVTSARLGAWIDAIASATSLAMAAWLYRASRIAVDETVARYGHNVDSGVYELVAANWYFLPAFAVLGFAAVAMFCGWAWRKLIHWLAWLLVLLPIVWLLASEIFRVMA
jgi:hypothetical protein